MIVSRRSAWREDPGIYIRESPLFAANQVKTPLMFIHNDGDNAGSMAQDLELFLALRRLHREAYLLNYHYEGHGLYDRGNLKHYEVHRDEFLNHFLLEGPEPAWMTSDPPWDSTGGDLTVLFGEKLPQ